MRPSSRNTAIAVAVALVGGAALGWLGRGRYDGAAGARQRAPAEAAEDERPTSQGAPPGAGRPHDDELREILALTDPSARALAARVRNASRVGGECEVEVDTSIGWFRAGCGSGETPSVGDKLELFGRVSPTGQIDGVPTLLRPSWLEPPGTIARLRGQ